MWYWTDTSWGVFISYKTEGIVSEHKYIDLSSMLATLVKYDKASLADGI